VAGRQVRTKHAQQCTLQYNLASPVAGASAVWACSAVPASNNWTPPRLTPFSWICNLLGAVVPIDLSLPSDAVFVCAGRRSVG
jgi:hypothetical protein